MPTASVGKDMGDFVSDLILCNTIQTPIQMMAIPIEFRLDWVLS